MTMPLTALLSMLMPGGNKKRRNAFISKKEDSDSDYEPSDGSDEEPTTKKHKTDKQFINEMFKNSGVENDEKEIAKY